MSGSLNFTAICFTVGKFVGVCEPKNMSTDNTEELIQGVFIAHVLQEQRIADHEVAFWFSNLQSSS